MAEYYVYMMTNVGRTLYVGVTNDLVRRVWEHEHKVAQGFTSRYQIDQLVWYEFTADVSAAIAREKQIKGWKRRRKVQLISGFNPSWSELSADWYGEEGEILRQPAAGSE